MIKNIQRIISLNLPGGKSAFLWGPRKVGKSFWIHRQYPQAEIVDLLKTDVFAEYASRPSLLRERYQDHKGLLVIDEVQKIPQLLDEVHWIIEHNKNISFLLTGSSVRKLRRGHANLLGGRAWRKAMVPLCFPEVPSMNLVKVMTSGLLPAHYLSSQPIEELRAYVADYLKEEIVAEALVQNIPSFSEFLHVAALTNSELLNYTNIAREAGISQKIVRVYFDILEDTYLGFRLPAWKKNPNRRMIQAEKFYFFDVGVANFLANRQPLPRSQEFGKSFEHYIMMEMKAYQTYRNPEMPLAFWRTSSGYEVDVIAGKTALAVEVKGSNHVHDNDLKGLRALAEDISVKRRVVVCLEDIPRKLKDGIEILPWQIFLKRLWAGELLK